MPYTLYAIFEKNITPSPYALKFIELFSKSPIL